MKKLIILIFLLIGTNKTKGQVLIIPTNDFRLGYSTDNNSKNNGYIIYNPSNQTQSQYYLQDQAIINRRNQEIIERDRFKQEKELIDYQYQKELEYQLILKQRSVFKPYTKDEEQDK